MDIYQINISNTFTTARKTGIDKRLTLQLRTESAEVALDTAKQYVEDQDIITIGVETPGGYDQDNYPVTYFRTVLTRRVATTATGIKFN